MSFTTINYNEGSKELRQTGEIVYVSVEIHHGKQLNEIKVFNSGNFVKDWYDRVKFMVTEIDDTGLHTRSSSVNHFIMDGAPYDTAWLKANKKSAELVYEQNGRRTGIELFVPKGTKPTWAELREMCDDPIKPKNELKKTKRST